MRLSLSAALLLVACAPAPPPQPQPRVAEAPLASIAFRISSWGRVVSEWRIAANGAATYTHAEGPGLGTRLVTRKFDAGPQGLARIRALLAPAERAAGAAPECGERWTDFPYGSVRWQRVSAERGLPFDLGCRNPALAPVHDALGKADKQMKTWSQGGEVIEDREMDQ